MAKPQPFSYPSEYKTQQFFNEIMDEKITVPQFYENPEVRKAVENLRDLNAQQLKRGQKLQEGDEFFEEAGALTNAFSIVKEVQQKIGQYLAQNVSVRGEAIKEDLDKVASWLEHALGILWGREAQLITNDAPLHPGQKEGTPPFATEHETEELEDVPLKRVHRKYREPGKPSKDYEDGYNGPDDARYGQIDDVDEYAVGDIKPLKVVKTPPDEYGSVDYTAMFEGVGIEDVRYWADEMGWTHSVSQPGGPYTESPSFHVEDDRIAVSWHTGYDI